MLQGTPPTSVKSIESARSMVNLRLMGLTVGFSKQQTEKASYIKVSNKDDQQEGGSFGPPRPKKEMGDLGNALTQESLARPFFAQPSPKIPI